MKSKLNKLGTSECNVCKIPNLLVQHHIRGRKIKNPNHKSNLCNICSNCHYKIHCGEIIIEDWLYSTSGPVLLWHLKNEQSITGRDAIVYLVH